MIHCSYLLGLGQVVLDNLVARSILVGGEIEDSSVVGQAI